MKNNFQKILFLTLFILLNLNLQAQNIYQTKEGYVKFFSKALIENITAENHKVSSVLKTDTGEMAFKVKINKFEFAKDLMKEHFNENYLESEKYPNAKFSGKILNIKDLDLSKDGKYDVEVEGKLTIHGKTKTYKAKGTLEKLGESIKANTVFMVVLKDHKIKIPKVVFHNIAEKVEITIKMDYKLVSKE